MKTAAKWDAQADIVVIGFGGAGAATAFVCFETQLKQKEKTW